jgi:hypothetical protein
MPLDNLTAEHIGQQGAVTKFEPQRSNNALLHIAGLQNVAAQQGMTMDSTDVLTLSLSSFPLPKRSVGIIEVGYLNEKRKFAGNPTYDDLSVVFKDYVDAGTAKILWAWNFAVHNPTNGKTGLKRNYGKNGWVQMFAPDGSMERQYDLFGIWPSSFDPGDIDMMGEEALNITVTLTIDKTIPSLGLLPDSQR